MKIRQVSWANERVGPAVVRVKSGMIRPRAASGMITPR